MPLPPNNDTPLDHRNRIRTLAMQDQTPCPICDEIGGHADDCEVTLASTPLVDCTEPKASTPE